VIEATHPPRLRILHRALLRTSIAEFVEVTAAPRFYNPIELGQRLLQGNLLSSRSFIKHLELLHVDREMSL